MARYGRADVRETAPVDAMIGQVAAAWGGVDVLVHNALTPYAIKPFREMTWDELGGKLDDEMRAAFTVTKAVLPTMTERRQGRLIYLGTGLSRRPRAGMIALGTAKAALTQFARYLAQELGPQGITVNVVEPGPVAETRISRVLDDEQRNRQIAATPLGRLAVPADVATVVAVNAGEDEAAHRRGRLSRAVDQAGPDHQGGGDRCGCDQRGEPAGYGHRPGQEPRAGVGGELLQPDRGVTTRHRQ